MEFSNNLKNKKVIAFDLDGTLAESKSAITAEMSDILCKLLEKYKVAIISGGAFFQFKKQIIDRLDNPKKEMLENLLLFPTTGSSLYVYRENDWSCIYEELLSEDEKNKIIESWNKSIIESGITLPEKTFGEIIEDRRTQISFSACGQQAPIEIKSIWDADQQKRTKIREFMQPLLPLFSINFGGTNTIDVTRIGVDKEYAINKLVDYLDVEKTDILFVGDKLEFGGNDYPAFHAGVDCISVSNPNETIDLVKKIIQ